MGRLLGLLLMSVFILGLSGCDGNTPTNESNSTIDGELFFDPSLSNITSVNSSAYPVSGVCDLSDGDVTVVIGTPNVEETFLCNSDGTFSGVIDVSAVTLNPPSVSASQGMETVTSPMLVNDQNGPLNAPTATAPGAYVGGGSSYNLPISCSEAREVVSISGVGLDPSPQIYTCAGSGAQSFSLSLESSLETPDPNNLTISSTDENGNPSATTITVNVPIDTQAPVLSISNSGNIIEGQVASFTITVADVSAFVPFTPTASSGTVSGACTSSPCAISVTGASSGALTLTAVVGTVADSLGNLNTVAASDSLDVNPNTAPTISNIGDQEINEDTSTQALSFSINDSEDTLSCASSVSMSSNNTSLIDSADVVFAGTAPNCTATLTPNVSQSGSATITLTVSDGSLTSTDTFTLLVENFVIQGDVITGKTLSVLSYRVGDSSSDPHQWYQDGAAIAGATGTSLVVGPTQEGKDITLRINGGSDSLALSNFYPNDLSLSLWLDSKDSSTVTVVSGAVSNWADKSGNNRDATQTVVASRPSLGLEGQVSATAGLFMRTGDGALSTGSGGNHSFIVGQGFENNTGTTSFAAAINNVSSARRWWRYTAEPAVRVNGHAIFAGGAISGKGIHALSYTKDSNFTTSGFWFNGSLRAPIDTNLGGVMNLGGAGALALGADSTGGALAPDGSLEFFEVVWIKEDSISEADRLMLEGYLAHKHNLIGSLPVAHPYKVIAP